MKTTTDSTVNKPKQLVPIQQNTHVPSKEICCICGEWKAVFADINDDPYKAFYCKECLLKE